MANDEMEREIEALRAQVEELTAEREAREKERAEAAASAQADESSGNTTKSDQDETGAAASCVTDLTGQFKELVETIDHELKDASPVTVLAVFAVGVLVGRLLPR